MLPPARLEALSGYCSAQGVDVAEGLTRVRNKLEHPTESNRQALAGIDGRVRMEVAQYGLELFELCMLGVLGYRGSYARRAFQGWKGQDQERVPWAV